MIKAVIFDMDGVLIDTEKYLVKYSCQAGQEAGFDMRPEHGLMIRVWQVKFAKPAFRKFLALSLIMKRSSTEKSADGKAA